MKLNRRYLAAFAALSVCGLAAGWLARVQQTQAVVVIVPAPVRMPAKPKALPAWTAAPPQRDTFPNGNTLEIFASNQAGEIIARFPTDESYDAFVYYLGASKVRVIDQLDRLRAVRIAYDEWTDFVELLDGEDVGVYDSMTAVPDPGRATANRREAVGFGDGLLPWLGITSDNSAWGAGVKIAVLDTGVADHPALEGISSIEVAPAMDDLTPAQGHATAVASLIASHDPDAPGIAPAAEIISIRISDESGRADSYSLAAGILAGVDAGAQLINISMGTPENNPLIEEAVSYALDHGVLIVAASGNGSRAEPMYPAAYPGVISVGSVDARGVHMDFSNEGSALSLTAPGYAINAAWPGDRTLPITGTSASTPLVTGAIAATMSDGNGVTMSPAEAAAIVMDLSDEAGLPGADSQYGSGILDLGRIMNRGIPGIIDVAITNQRILAKGEGRPNDEIQVTIQNRGTATLSHVLVETSSGLAAAKFESGTLVPDAIQSFTIPLRQDGRNAEIQVTSRLTLGPLEQDITPQNNHRTDTLWR